MRDQLIAMLLVLIGGVALAVVSRTIMRRWERTLVMLSFVAHVGAAQAQIWITRNVFGGGDMFMYQLEGVAVANAVREGADGMLLEVFKLLFQQESWIPVHVTGAGNSTGSMTAVTALLSLLTYNSLAATCTAVAILSFVGKLVLYVALRDSLHEDVHQRILIACLLIPSVVYWSSGLLKESIAMAGLGWLVAGTQELVRSQWVRGVVLATVGIVPIAFIKPYVLLAFSVSAAVWYYWNRVTSRKRRNILSQPLRVVIGLGLGVGAVAVLGQLFPRFAFDSLGEQLALQQEISQTVRGGSTYELGDPTRTTTLGQLAFAPQAIVASFFRPFLWEASNLQILINSLETTTLTALLVRVLWKERLMRLWSCVRASPILMFFLVFSITFGVAIGLGTANLGTLSRYRVPLMPFYTGLILVLDHVVMKGRSPAKARRIVPWLNQPVAELKSPKGTTVE